MVAVWAKAEAPSKAEVWAKDAVRDKAKAWDMDLPAAEVWVLHVRMRSSALNVAKLKARTKGEEKGKV